jgi:acetylornithine deacetylase/succinyl-diaminopimelate desuccinylase-like protein
MIREPAVQAALAAAKKNEPKTLEEQILLCEIPAPPFKETRRAEAYKSMFEDLGLQNVRMDDVGNVLGERPGRRERPHLVLSAHLDTVFPEETDVKTTRSGTTIRGPGIGDDCRGLAVVLGVVRALEQARVQTQGRITFVATVGEEGLGDLRGVRRLFEHTLKDEIDRFVSIDGTGLGITNVAVGSYRYRVAYRGPGGHSFGAFGMANPIHALGRAIGKIAGLQVPKDPKTTFNVGRIGGGTSVNSIASEAWMEVDMRSADPASLHSLEERFRNITEQALKEENERWDNRGRLSLLAEPAGVRPAGQTAESSPIVQAAMSVSRALGLLVRLSEGSTDSNIPMSMNIPALTIGGGGTGRGAHSLGEVFDSKDSWEGTQRATLLAIVLAQ